MRCCYLVVIVSCFLLVGCSTPAGKQKGSATRLEVLRPEKGAQALSGRIAVAEVVRDEANAHVSLVNNTREKLNVEYRFAWFDKEGYEVRKGKAEWFQLALIPLRATTISAPSPVPTAIDFWVEIRPEE